MEQGAGPPVGVKQVEVDILTGAEQAVIVVVSVEDNKAR